jgi:hypothetical protein
MWTVLVAVPVLAIPEIAAPVLESCRFRIGLKQFSIRLSRDLRDNSLSTG